MLPGALRVILPSAMGRTSPGSLDGSRPTMRSVNQRWRTSQSCRSRCARHCRSALIRVLIWELSARDRSVDENGYTKVALGHRTLFKNIGSDSIPVRTSGRSVLHSMLVLEVRTLTSRRAPGFGDGTAHRPTKSSALFDLACTRKPLPTSQYGPRCPRRRGSSCTLPHLANSWNDTRTGMFIY